MWEEEPVGVDPKRPLVGFALVAVLCAVLMTLSSVGRGWGGELFHPGKPIAAPSAGSHLDRVPSPAPQRVQHAEANIPAELSTQPLGVAVGAPAAKKAVSRPTVETETVAETTAPDSTRAADKATAKAQRQADKAAAKALRQADKAAAKAQRQADKAAAQAQREADKAAEQATAEAARLLDQLLRIDAKAAEKALRQG